MVTQIFTKKTFIACSLIFLFLGIFTIIPSQASFPGTLYGARITTSTARPGELNLLSFSMKPENSLTTGDLVKIEFPVAFDLSTLTSGDITVSGSGIISSGPATIDIPSNSITTPLTLAGSAHGFEPISIVVSNINNPVTVDLYNIIISTLSSSLTLKDSQTVGMGVHFGNVVDFALNQSLVLSNQTKGATSSYDFGFKETIQDHDIIRLEFPKESDISAVTISDISTTTFPLSLSTFSFAILTFNTTENYIDLQVDTAGDTTSARQHITVNNVTNPTTAFIGYAYQPTYAYNAALSVFDGSMVLKNRGEREVAIFGDTPTMSFIPTSQLTSHSSTYTIKYTPFNNLENNGKILLSFPPDFDLSSLTPSDITLTGATFGSNTTLIDNAAHTITIIADMPFGDSNGQELTIIIDTITNPTVAGNYTIGLDQISSMDTLLDYTTYAYDVVNTGIVDIPVFTLTPSAYKGAFTQMDIEYNFPITSFPGESIEILFDTTVDLSSIQATQISYNGGLSPSTTTIDDTQHKIILEGIDVDNNSEMSIEYFIAPNTSGTHTVTVSHKNALGETVNTGTKNYTIEANPKSLTINGTDFYVNQQQNYTLQYNSSFYNLHQDWYVAATFPAGFDLSSVTNGDIHSTISDHDAPSSIIVNPATRKVEVRLVPSSGFGYSMSQVVSELSINNMINPPTPGIYPIQIDIYDENHIFIESITQNITVTSVPVAQTGVAISLSESFAGLESTYTLTGFRNTNLPDFSEVVINFPNSTPDLSMITPADITLLTGLNNIRTPRSVSIDNTLKQITIIMDAPLSADILGDSTLRITISKIINHAWTISPMYDWFILSVTQKDNSSTPIFRNDLNYLIHINPPIPVGHFSNTLPLTAQSSRINPLDLQSKNIVVSSQFSHPVPSKRATKYWVQVATTPTFNLGTMVYDSGMGGVVLPTPLAPGQRSPDISIPAATLNENTLYYWRMLFYDNDGYEGEWSMPFDSMSEEFKIVPTAPAPISGGGGSGGGQSTPSTPSTSPLLPSAPENTTEDTSVTSSQTTRKDFTPESSLFTPRNSTTTIDLTQNSYYQVTPSGQPIITYPDAPRISSIVSTQGFPTYEASLCPTLTKQIYLSDIKDTEDPVLEDYAKSLLKKGVAFDVLNNTIDPGAKVLRSDILKYVIQGNCDQFAQYIIDTKPFQDVPLEHRNVLYVSLAKLRNIVSGYLSDYLFRPDQYITRAEALKIVIEASLGNGKRTFDGTAEPYTDINWKDDTVWFRNYVRYAYEKGIITLPKNKEFRPYDQVNKSEIIYMLSRALATKNT